MNIDASVYPDTAPPKDFRRIGDRADYIHRICSAWDFGIIPTNDTFALFETWKDAFDAFPALQSVAYHAFRAWFGWEPLAGRVLTTPGYLAMDRRDGRVDKSVI